MSPARLERTGSECATASDGWLAIDAVGLVADRRSRLSRPSAVHSPVRLPDRHSGRRSGRACGRGRRLCGDDRAQRPAAREHSLGHRTVALRDHTLAASRERSADRGGVADRNAGCGAGPRRADWTARWPRGGGSIGNPRAIAERPLTNRLRMRAGIPRSVVAAEITPILDTLAAENYRAHFSEVAARRSDGAFSGADRGRRRARW